MGKVAEAMAASMNSTGESHDDAAVEPKAKGKRGGTKPGQRKAKSGGAQPKGSAVKAGPVVASLSDLPPGTTRVVELGELTFDPDMQKRTAIFDEFTVEKYAEQYQEAVARKAEDPDAPDPWEVLPQLRAIDTGDALVIYDGFQRGEAANRAKLEKVWVVITPGTRGDAEFYALRANAQHGLARSSEDCRRAFFSALDNPELFARIEAQKDRYGGLNRALAAACGISKGAVSNYLRLRGKTIRGGKIVRLPTQHEAPPKPAPASAGTTTSEPAAPGLFDDAAPTTTGQELIDRLTAADGTTEAEQSARIKAAATRVIAHEAMMLAAKLSRLCEGLATRPEAFAAMAPAADQAQIPFETKEDVNAGEFGTNGATIEKRTVWPVLTQVLWVLEVAKAAVAEKPAVDPLASLPPDAAADAHAAHAAQTEPATEDAPKGGKKGKGKGGK